MWCSSTWLNIKNGPNVCLDASDHIRTMFGQPAGLAVDVAGPDQCLATLCLLRVWSGTGRDLAAVCLKTEYRTKLIRCFTGSAFTDVGPGVGQYGLLVLLRSARGFRAVLMPVRPLLRQSSDIIGDSSDRPPPTCFRPLTGCNHMFYVCRCKAIYTGINECFMMV